MRGVGRRAELLRGLERGRLGAFAAERGPSLRRRDERRGRRAEVAAVQGLGEVHVRRDEARLAPQRRRRLAVDARPRGGGGGLGPTGQPCERVPARAPRRSGACRAASSTGAAARRRLGHRSVSGPSASSPGPARGAACPNVFYLSLRLDGVMRRGLRRDRRSETSLLQELSVCLGAGARD